MEEIVVVGKEEFTFGFELVGIKSHPLEKLEELMNKKDEIGIIILAEEDYATLPTKLTHQIDRLIKPIIVILSKNDIKGGNLRQAVIRALGVDLLK